MKFINILEEIKRKEENKNKIILAKCGAFFVAIGKDAVILQQNYGLKLTCAKTRLCKIGIPISSIMKYVDLLEMSDYSFAIYDYDKETKRMIQKNDREMLFS